MYFKPRIFFLIIIGSVLLSLSIGVIIGYFSSPKRSSLSEGQKAKLNYYDTLIRDWNSNLLDEIIKETKTELIRENLR